MSQIQLAFTPQSNWQMDHGLGTAGSIWPVTLLTIPPTLFRRRVYLLHGLDPVGSGFNLQGRVIFSLNGINVTEIPYHPGNIGISTLPSPIAWSGVQGTQPLVENGITVKLGANGNQSFNLWPVDFVAQADRMELRIDSGQNTSGTDKPIWFVACLSMSQW